MTQERELVSQFFYVSHKKLLMLYARNLWINMMQWQNHNKGHKNWKCKKRKSWAYYDTNYTKCNMQIFHLVTMATLGLVWEWDWYKTKINTNMTWWTMLSVTTIRRSRGTLGLHHYLETVSLWGVPRLRYSFEHTCEVVLRGTSALLRVRWVCDLGLWWG